MTRQMNQQDLSGKTALITGGTKGIGQAIAIELAQAGAKVIVTARTSPGKETPGQVFLPADLTQAADVAKLEGEITARFGAVDILVNNAGGLTTPGGGFSMLSDADWEPELQLNLLSAIRTDRAFLPGMIERKSGVIIHVSSVSGRQALWQLNMAYAVSKAALNSYSKTLATELGPKGVRVLTVSPGATRTPPMEKVISDFAGQAGISVEEAMKQLMAQIGGIPMGRMAEPSEVAALIHFLVSPAAGYLTGTNYAIDGGSLPVV